MARGGVAAGSESVREAGGHHRWVQRRCGRTGDFGQTRRRDGRSGSSSPRRIAGWLAAESSWQSVVWPGSASERKQPRGRLTPVPCTGRAAAWVHAAPLAAPCRGIIGVSCRFTCGRPSGRIAPRAVSRPRRAHDRRARQCEALRGRGCGALKTDTEARAGPRRPGTRRAAPLARGACDRSGSGARGVGRPWEESDGGACGCPWHVEGAGGRRRRAGIPAATVAGPSAGPGQPRALRDNGDARAKMRGPGRQGPAAGHRGDRAGRASARVAERAGAVS